MSDLDLHCLPMSNKKDASLIWVKIMFYHSLEYLFSSLINNTELKKVSLSREHVEFGVPTSFAIRTRFKVAIHPELYQNGEDIPERYMY